MGVSELVCTLSQPLKIGTEIYIYNIYIYRYTIYLNEFLVKRINIKVLKNVYNSLLKLR